MKPDDKPANKRARRWLFKMVRTARGWVLISVGLGLGSGILLIGQARLLANIVHGAFMDDVPREDMWPFFAGLLTVVISRAALGWGREVAGFCAGAKVREVVRMSLMEHIFTLGPDYVSRQRTGALASTTMENVEGLHDFYAFYLPQLALAAIWRSQHWWMPASTWQPSSTESIRSVCPAVSWSWKKSSDVAFVRRTSQYATSRNTLIGICTTLRR